MPDVAKRIRDYYESAAKPVTVEEILAESVGPEPEPRSRHAHGWLIAAAAALVVLVLVGGVTLLVGVRGGISPVGTQPITPAPEESATPAPEESATTEATTTTTSPTTAVASFTTESGVLHLAAQALTLRIDSPLAGVDVHGHLAFVGGMSVGYYSDQNAGVRIVDLSDPENPEQVGLIPLRHDSYFFRNDPHGHGDAVVTSLTTTWFSGDVAIVRDGVPNTYDGANYPEVFGMWDVTEPSEPRFLEGVISLGLSPLGNGGTLGDKPFDSMAVSDHYFFTLYDAAARSSSRPNDWSDGDVHMGVVDISNPREPVQIADWQDDPEVYLQGLSLNDSGTRAFLTGVWPPPAGEQSGDCCSGEPSRDGFLYIIDVENPAVPNLIGTYRFPLRGLPSSMSKAVPTPDETHVLLLDHSWQRGNEGIVLILDITDLDNIRQVAAFDPEIPPQAPDEGRVFRIATDVVIRGDLAFVSWLRDGVLAIDISDPLNPVQVGQFTSLYEVDTNQGGVPFGNDLSDLALVGDRYLVATTVWGPRMYVLEVLDEPAG